jgi:hypothetical protein
MNNFEVIGILEVVVTIYSDIKIFSKGGFGANLPRRPDLPPKLETSLQGGTVCTV